MLGMDLDLTTLNGNTHPLPLTPYYPAPNMPSPYLTDGPIQHLHMLNNPPPRRFPTTADLGRRWHDPSPGAPESGLKMPRGPTGGRRLRKAGFGVGASEVNTAKSGRPYKCVGFFSVGNKCCLSVLADSLI